MLILLSEVRKQTLGLLLEESPCLDGLPGPLASLYKLSLFFTSMSFLTACRAPSLTSRIKSTPFLSSTLQDVKMYSAMSFRLDPEDSLRAEIQQNDHFLTVGTKTKGLNLHNEYKKQL